MQELCLSSVVLEIAVVHYGSLPVYYCQQMGLQRHVGGSVEVMIAVDAVVALAILQS